MVSEREREREREKVTQQTGSHVAPGAACAALVAGCAMCLRARLVFDAVTVWHHAGSVVVLRAMGEGNTLEAAREIV